MKFIIIIIIIIGRIIGINYYKLLELIIIIYGIIITNGRMGVEYQMFLKHLADNAVVITWLRTRLSFEILRSVQTSIRGSRMPFHKTSDFIEDFHVNVNAAGIL